MHRLCTCYRSAPGHYQAPHPAVADMDPRLFPLSTQADFDMASIDVVINTHLHFEPAGNGRLDQAVWTRTRLDYAPEDDDRQ